MIRAFIKVALGLVTPVHEPVKLPEILAALRTRECSK
jgi:hypothetical protein